jgi:hypothetical protein
VGGPNTSQRDEKADGDMLGVLAALEDSWRGHVAVEAVLCLPVSSS